MPFKAREIVALLPFTNMEMTNILSFVSDIWILWNQDVIRVEVINKSKQEIYAMFKVNLTTLDHLLSGIYAKPRLNNRKILCNNFKSIANVHNLP